MTIRYRFIGVVLIIASLLVIFSLPKEGIDDKGLSIAVNIIVGVAMSAGVIFISEKK